MGSSFNNGDQEREIILTQSLLPEAAVKNDHNNNFSELWINELKKLWNILGPAIVVRISGYSMIVITQAFAGHLGDVELAAFSVALNVIIGFTYGLLLGMASALETLCGQAYGAKKYDIMSVYLQRSWIVLFSFSLLLLPIYIFASPLLKLLGQSSEVAEATGKVALWMIPMHFSFGFQFTLQRFLQSQLKNAATAWVAVAGLVVNAVTSWLFVSVLDFGVVGAALALGLSWWVSVFGLLAYAAYGGCPLTWAGFSVEAFSELWDFIKLSAASGVMLCLENWYYKILILLAGYLKDATIAVDALSVCMSITGWEMMIPLAFLAATGIRVANELGRGNGEAAKFATTVSVTQSTIIGLFFCLLVIILRDKIAYIFTSSSDVIQAVDDLWYFLVLTILLNSVQPVLSGTHHLNH